jgi:hypothetical protein
MYIDTDFGNNQFLDEVRLDTSPDYLNVRLQVEMMDKSGNWVKIQSEPRTEEIPAPVAIRRWANLELHARGIDYILMQDTDWGADDMREDPESWGFKEIARGHGARIYKVVSP